MLDNSFQLFDIDSVQVDAYHISGTVKSQRFAFKRRDGVVFSVTVFMRLDGQTAQPTPVNAGSAPFPEVL